MIILTSSYKTKHSYLFYLIQNQLQFYMKQPHNWIRSCFSTMHIYHFLVLNKFWSLRITCECYKQIWISKFSTNSHCILVILNLVSSPSCIRRWKNNSSPLLTASCNLLYNSLLNLDCSHWRKPSFSFSIEVNISTTYCWNNLPLLRIWLLSVPLWCYLYMNKIDELSFFSTFLKLVM